jgi:hypothetical protein
MAKQEHALANLTTNKFDRSNPRIQKAARKEASTDEVSIDKRRVNFQHEGREIREVIKFMQSIKVKIREVAEKLRKETLMATDRAKLEAEKHDLEELYADAFNISSLKSTVVLFEGLALIADMLSVEQYVKDPETKKREYFRVTAADMLWDVMRYTEKTAVRTLRTAQMLDHVGITHQWWTKGHFMAVLDNKAVDEEDEEEDEDGEEPAAEVLDTPLAPGVPTDDLTDAKTHQEKVIKMIRGDDDKQV